MNDLIDTVKTDVKGLAEEWKHFGSELGKEIKRLRKPSLNYKDREHFVLHVIVAILETFWDAIPSKTMPYLSVVALVVWIL